MAVYLGPAGNLMALPRVDRGFKVSFDGGISAARSMANALATQRPLMTKRNWDASISNIDGDEIRALIDLYKGAYGTGPFCFLDPSWRNVLPLDVSLMGARLADPDFLPNGGTGWTPSAGTVAVSTAVTEPVTGPAGVLAWTGAGSGSLLFAGPNAALDSSWHPPIVGALPVTWSVYARCASGTPQLSARLSRATATAYVGNEVSGTTAALSSSAWTRISVTRAAGAWTAGSVYAVPYLQCHTGSAPVIYLSRPQFEYATTPGDWESGEGSPRVNFLDELDHAVQFLPRRSIAVRLGEV